MPIRSRVLAIALVAFSAFSAYSGESSPDELTRAIEVARGRVFPTLVHIQPIFDFARDGRTIESSSTGSGAIIRADGLVVTNYHVAGTAKRVVCTLADRRKCSAKLIGADAATDLALLRLELSELGLAEIEHATFSSHLPREGEFVVAMGSPLGLTRSLSFGVVSCSQRYLGEMSLSGGAKTGIFNTWIQTDAAINPGNSGGPLVALDGTIVGVNSRGYDRADNLGFAIPASVVTEVIEELLEKGRVERSSIGVRIQPSVPLEGERGALVSSVEGDSPAARAGIRAGDRIVRYAGTLLDVRFEEDLPDAMRCLASAQIGIEIELELQRACELETLCVTPLEWRLQGEDDVAFESLGLTLKVLPKDELRKRFVSRETALLVSGLRPGGSADRAKPRLRAGDIVLDVDGAAVDSTEAFRAALEMARADERASVVLTVARGRGEWRIALGLPPVESEVATSGGK